MSSSINSLLRQYFGASGVFYFAWMIPYGAGVLILGVLFFRFLLALPRQTLILFIASGVIFVSGAIGFELPGSLENYLHGETLRYLLLATIEEMLEMTGLVLFNYALLRHIGNDYPGFHLRFSK